MFYFCLQNVYLDSPGWCYVDLVSHLCFLYLLNHFKMYCQSYNFFIFKVYMYYSIITFSVICDKTIILSIQYLPLIDSIYIKVLKMEFCKFIVGCSIIISDYFNHNFVLLSIFNGVFKYTTSKTAINIRIKLCWKVLI